MEKQTGRSKRLKGNIRKFFERRGCIHFSIIRNDINLLCKMIHVKCKFNICQLYAVSTKILKDKRTVGGGDTYL